MKTKLEIRYGILFALIVIVYVMLEHFLGLNTSNHQMGQYTRFGGVLVPILGIFFGLNAKCKELGSLSTKQGIRSGFIIALIQTSLTTLWFLIYPNFINPEFYSTMLEFEREKMIAQGLSQTEVTEKLETLKTMFSVPVQPIFQMIVGVIYGVFFAWVFSLFFRLTLNKVSESRLEQLN